MNFPSSIHFSKEDFQPILSHRTRGNDRKRFIFDCLAWKLQVHRHLKGIGASMRYVYLIALAGWLAVPPESSCSQEPTADQRLTRSGGSSHRPKSPNELNASSSEPSAPDSGSTAPDSESTAPVPKRLPRGLFTETSLLHFRLIEGRLELDPVRYRKGKQEFTCPQFSESVSVSCSDGIPSAYYQYEDRYQQIRLSVEHGRRLRIESTLLATGERATLEQVTGQLIRWSTIRDPETSHLPEADSDVTGATLLHLIASDEAGFHIHLRALLQRMLLGRDVIEISHQTQKRLLVQSNQLKVVSQDEVEQLIDRLRARTLRERRAASIELTRMASVAVPHLRAALRRGDLDAEQRERIEAVLDVRSRIDEDTPASLACLLSADRRHWELIAKKLDHQQWLAINDHIRNCGLPALVR